MSQVNLNAKQFKTRIQKLRTFIKQDTLAVILGKTEDCEQITMNSALFLYLLNYEFPETLLLVNQKNLVVLTSPKKAALIEQLLKENDIKILVRKKDGSNEEELKKEIKAIVGNKIGLLDKESIKGKYSESMLSGFEVSDISNTVYPIFKIKEEAEIENIKRAGFCNQLLIKKCINMLTKGAQERERTTYKEVAEKVEEMLDSPLKELPRDINQNNIEFSYSPIISDSLNDSSPEASLIYSEVFMQFCLRYHGYCSTAIRTLLFNPNEEQISNLKRVYALQEKIIEIIKNEKSALKIKEQLEKEKINYLIQSEGILEKEGFVIKNEEEIEKDFILEEKMVLSIKVFDTYVLGDTFSVSNKELVYLTHKSSVEEFLFYFKETKGLRLRNKARETEKNIQRIEHQKELMDKLIEERISYYKSKTYEENVETKKEVEYFGYKKENLIPRQAKLFVDKKNGSVLVPVYGYLVPFHINSIKNISKNEEEYFSFLRINFNAEEKKADSLKSLTFKGKNHFIQEAFKEINELKKDFNLKKETVNEEINLEEFKEIKGRKYVLTDVLIKTDVRSRKNKTSSLELHENGFKYVNEEHKVEILFSSIKHVFYQEGTVDNRTILHFHLFSSSPSFVGKKVLNIQFSREAGSSKAYDTSKNNKNDAYMEMILDKEEEERRQEINREFRMFIDKIEEATSLRVEPLFVDMSFMGVPFKESVSLTPTLECLVNLTDFPFFVLTLSEVEVVNFERVMYGVKTCDMVFIFKNTDQPPQSVFSVEAACAPKIQEFLDSKNICFIETKVNIQWPRLLKTLMADPLQFYENGAWAELQPNRDSEEEEDVSTTMSSTSEVTSEEEEFNTEASISTVSEEFEGEDDIEDLGEYGESEYDESEEESEDRYKKKRRR